MSIFILFGLLRCLACGLAEAALFVYKPKNFRALPWIVLAVMETLLLYEIIYYFGYFPSDLYGMLYAFCNMDYINLIACALPIITFFVLQIVRTNQKKKQNA